MFLQFLVEISGCGGLNDVFVTIFSHFGRNTESNRYDGLKIAYRSEQSAILARNIIILFAIICWKKLSINRIAALWSINFDHCLNQSGISTLKWILRSLIAYSANIETWEDDDN